MQNDWPEGSHAMAWLHSFLFIKACSFSGKFGLRLDVRCRLPLADVTTVESKRYCIALATLFPAEAPATEIADGMYDECLLEK